MRRLLPYLISRVLLVFVIWIGAQSPALAKGPPAGTPVAVCLARGAGEDAATLFRHSERFDCRRQQADFGDGDFWALSKRLPAGTGLTPIRVRNMSVWQDRLTLHLLYADGRVVALPPLDDHGITRHLQLGTVVEQTPPVRGVPIVRLLWHIQGAANTRGVLVGASIATPAESAGSNLLLGALYAAFGGLCIALLVYNLALWAALRHHFQLAYCAMVFSLMLYALSSSGALAWAWPAIANTDRLRINCGTLAIAAAAALYFARSFFEPNIFAGWPNRVVQGLVAALLITGGLFVVLAPWHMLLLDRLFAGVFVLELGFIPVLLWHANRRKSNYLGIFTVAWAAPVIFASVRVANTFHLLPWSFWIDNSTLISMTVEALLSSLAIAYRIRLVADERDEARTQEIAARLLADTDPLTGLLNRRAFLARAIGRPGDQVLLIADIDYFKRVNDTIGHDGGDEVLRVVARALRNAVPPDSLIARIGGEEFAIIAHAGTAPSPNAVLDTLRASRMPFDIAVTASIGTCTGPLLRETDWKALYRSADGALFAAKAAGRDRARDASARAA